MILNVIKYSSALITILLGYQYIKTERERILLLLKEKDEMIQVSLNRIQKLEETLNNNTNYSSKSTNTSVEMTPYSSCDEGNGEGNSEGNNEANDEDIELNDLIQNDLVSYEKSITDQELDTDKTNYDTIDNLHNDTSEDSIEELINSDDSDKSQRGVIEFTD